MVLLLKKPDPFKFADVLSFLIAQGGRLDWKKLIKFARLENVLEELGFCLDAVNEEAGRPVFSKRLVAELYDKSPRQRKEFSLREQKKGPFAEPSESGFRELAEKWNLETAIPRSSVAKVVHDLVHSKRKDR